MGGRASLTGRTGRALGTDRPLTVAAVVIAAATALASTAHAAVPATVKVQSLDVSAGEPISLPGYWFAAAAPVPAAAVVLLHGCAGAYDRHGELGERMIGYAARLNALGIHALVVDSLTPRGEHEICTQRGSQRRVHPAQRRLDAWGALAWLAAQPGVDRERLGLIGWSNGGSTTLAATDARDAAWAQQPVHPAFAVAFYPNCSGALAAGWQVAIPLLMLIGSADDWTPAQPCRRLAGGQPQVTLVEYEGAYHGFDGSGSVRVRHDVAGGTRPGQGVHVGGDPAARAAALQRLDEFLRQVDATGR